MMEMVLNVIFIIVECIFHYYVAEAFLENKKEGILRYSFLFLSAIFLILFDMLQIVLPEQGIYASIVQWGGTLGVFFLLCFCYRGKVITKVINIVFFLVISALVESIIFLFSIVLLHIQAEQIWEQPLLYNILKGISSIIILLVGLIIRYAMEKRKQENTNVNLKEFILFAIVNTMVMVLGVHLTQNWSRYNIGVNEEITLLVGMSMAITLIFFVSIVRLSKHGKKEMELQLKLQKMELEKKYRDDLQEVTMKLRTLRHDMNHHIGVMQGLLHMQQYEELDAYFKKIAETSYEANDMVVSYSKTLSALIYSKIQYAKESGVELEYHITQQKIPMEEQDLCSLVGNLLNNAIEAAMKSEEKYACISMEFPEDKLLIRCENSYTEIPKKNPLGGFYTSKSKKEEHGIGTKAIEEIVEKYEGTQEYTFEDYVIIEFTFPFVNKEWK